MKKFICLLSLVLMTIQAKAESIPVNLLICDDGGEFAYPRQTAATLYKDAVKYISAKTTAKPYIISTIVKRCNLPTDYKELYAGRQFGRIYRFFQRAKIIRKNRINFAILPALSDSDKRGIGGASTGICTLLDEWNVSISAISPINTSVGQVGYASVTDLIHESLHALGAFHTYNTPHDIMDLNPLPFSVDSIPNIARETKEDINYCLNQMKSHKVL